MIISFHSILFSYELPNQALVFLMKTFRLRLGGENVIEWKEYFKNILPSLLFGSFNGVNEKFIPLFGSLSGRKRNE